MAKTPTDNASAPTAASQTPERVDLRSADVVAARREELLRLFPEARTEGSKLDLDKLKLALGEAVDVGKERYGMVWPGKADCWKTIQAPSLATLRPCVEESVAWDSTENLIIEGDNLEVLKLLQKSYLGKVKMIYIDPPYNTGNDFIYPDNFSESLQTYLQYTGQVDAHGKRFGTNTDTDGRFHSKCLNMMYPRLCLARNLLRDDGLVLVSINDVELANLLGLCNEIFGESNHVATFVLVNEGNIDNQSRVKVNHEYVIAYARNESLIPPPPVVDPNIPKTSKIFRETIENTVVQNGPANPVSGIELPVGFPADFDRGQVDPKGDFWPQLSSKIVVQGGRTKNPATATSGWKCKDLLQDFIRNKFDSVLDGKGQPTDFYLSKTGAIFYRKKRLDDQSHVLTVLRGMGTVQSASAYLEKLGIAFSYPKPTGLLEYLVRAWSSDGDVVLDFFAGSGTTAQAVLEVNRRYGTNRKFVLVQLPEASERGEHKTIADITKERVRRVILRLNAEDAEKPATLFDDKAAPAQDRGFRVFKLAESSFMPWEADAPQDAATLAKQIEMHVEHIRPGRSPDDLVQELLLKTGFPLTTPIEKLTLVDKTVYSAAGGLFLLCLERKLTLDLIRAIADKKPERVVCLDLGFAGNDQLKTNAVQIFKTKGVQKFLTV